MTINSNKCACTLTRQTLFRVTLRLCFVRFRTIGHSPPGLRRLFVFHRANTILVTVHSILFYLIPIKGQRCIGHLLLLFPPSRVDARFCFISNWLRSDALIFHPSLRFLSSFAKLYVPSAVDLFLLRIRWEFSLFLFVVHLPGFVCAWTNDSITTRWKRRESDLCSIRLLDRYTGNFAEVRIQPRFRNLSEL